MILNTELSAIKGQGKKDMDDFNWECPHCQKSVTISSSRYSEMWHILKIENSSGRHSLISKFFVCPNPECQKFTLSAELHRSFHQPNGYEASGGKLKTWNLMPPSNAKSFPDYIPKQIQKDYEEACLIKEGKPKSLCNSCQKVPTRHYKRFLGC